MNTELIEKLHKAQEELTPQFGALRAATGALKQAVRLASEEKLDALAMQKVLAKLEQAKELLEVTQLSNESAEGAISAFAEQTQEGLNALAFEFARDLKETFEARGQVVEGRPPTLVMGELVLNIDIAARKAQWLYGKEPLTRLIPLSINAIVRAYDQQHRAIMERKLDGEFVQQLHATWEKLVAKRTQRPSGGRINLTEIYSQMVLDRQSARFWNAPSRSTFKDYDRPHFIRDIVLAQTSPSDTENGTSARFQLAIASKSQAERASQSMWIPSSALDGNYYASITFDKSQE